MENAKWDTGAEQGAPHQYYHFVTVTRTSSRPFPR